MECNQYQFRTIGHQISTRAPSQKPSFVVDSQCSSHGWWLQFTPAWFQARCSLHWWSSCQWWWEMLLVKLLSVMVRDAIGEALVSDGERCYWWSSCQWWWEIILVKLLSVMVSYAIDEALVSDGEICYRWNSCQWWWDMLSMKLLSVMVMWAPLKMLEGSYIAVQAAPSAVNIWNLYSH